MIAFDVLVIAFTFIASVAIAWFVLYPLFAGRKSEDKSDCNGQNADIY